MSPSGSDEVLRLKKVLYSEYGGFADKRVKRLERGSTFIADDRSRADEGADGRLFSWFCLIFVEVVSATTVKVVLSGGVPTGTSVNAWIAKNKSALKIASESGLTFMVQQGQEGKLIELADAFAAIVAPGKSYTVKAYKYVAPRTARSLNRLAQTLTRAWTPQG